MQHSPHAAAVASPAVRAATRVALALALLVALLTTPGAIGGGGARPAPLRRILESPPLPASAGAAGVPLRAPGCVGDCAAVRACVSEQAALLDAAAYEHARTSPRLARARPLAAAFPLHEPRFSFGLDTMRKRRSVSNGTLAFPSSSSSWDIFFVFFGEEQASGFERYVRERAPELADYYSPLLMPETLLVDIDAVAVHERNYADLKHLYALATLHPCYEQLVVMDADAEVVRPERLLAAAQSRLSNRRVFGMHAPMMRGFMSDDSTMCASAEDAPRLRNLTRDFALFAWWSDLPAFRSADVPHFLKYARWPRTCRLLSYEMWSVLHRNWSFVDLTAEIGLAESGLECLSDSRAWDAWAARYPPGPLWAAKRTCAALPGGCLDPRRSSIAVVYHADRTDATEATRKMCIQHSWA